MLTDGWMYFQKHASESFWITTALPWELVALQLLGVMMIVMTIVGIVKRIAETK